MGSANQEMTVNFAGELFFAFTIKPFLVLPYRIFIGILGMLYVLFGGILLFLFGFRPTFKDFFHGWWHRDEFDLGLLHDEPKGCSFWKAWRLWEYEPKEKIPVWAVPIFIPVEMVVLCCTILGVWLLFESLSLIGIIIGAVVFLIAAVTVTIVTKRFIADKENRKRRKEERERVRKEQYREKREQEYLEFLRENTSFSNGYPSSVDLKKIRANVGTLTKFQIDFWIAKAKVCKPFEK